MAFYGTIPEAPDIRKQRPGYFAQREGPDFGSGFAMPQGMQPYDPEADRYQDQVPDLWPEIQAELQGILQKGPGQYFTKPVGGELTPEQAEHNKMLMAWKSPAGLSAIETGKYRESTEKARVVDQKEKRVANLEKQLLAAHKAEAPQDIIKHYEQSYNRAADSLDQSLDEPSMLPRYTGEGKFKLKIKAGEEPGPGIMSRIKGWFQGGEGPPAAAEGFETPEQVAAAPAEMAPMKSNLILRGLIEAERLMIRHLGNEEAKELIVNINAETKDPNERLEKAIAAVGAKNPKSPGLKKLKAQRTIWNMTRERKLQQSYNPPGMPVTRRYSRGIPEPGGG
ncbi:MAG: hypothetical protein ACXAB9_10965 [Candidatus Thorarchaeota archaeon]|jgi:hypothetical protein